MGIKNFSKIFEGREIKLKSLKNKCIAVDASIIMFKSCLGINNINGLTDSDGNSTIHINVIISKILNFKKNYIDQRWVFDFYEKDYINNDKILEHTKRKNVKDKALTKIKELTKIKNSISNDIDELFSESDGEDDSANLEQKCPINIENQINKQKKLSFTLNERIVNDTKYILDCFDIPWCQSPKGFEAENICAKLTNTICDCVWSTDTDAIIYGATQLIRDIKIKNKKILMSYEIENIIHDNTINIVELRKIAVIMGCDHCPKTPKIGPKTILKKFKDIQLTDDQNNAVKIFESDYDISNLLWSIYDTNIMDKFNPDKINNLLNWLASKDFNIERIKTQIKKVE
jgi:hypothetical protein